MALNEEADKLIFLNELNTLQHHVQREWLVGDFNMKTGDKNNSRLNRCLMGKFKAVLNNLELRELPLHGRKFTWTSSNSALSEATMTRIDRMFCTTTWEEFSPLAHLHAWASTVSDHSPLILQGDSCTQKFKGFRFETYWLKIPGFQDVVKQAWSKPLQATDALRRLHIKLARTAKALKAWEKASTGTRKKNSNPIRSQLQIQTERHLFGSVGARENEGQTKIKTIQHQVCRH
jgi:hypothetical protein